MQELVAGKLEMAVSGVRTIELEEVLATVTNVDSLAGNVDVDRMLVEVEIAEPSDVDVKLELNEFVLVALPTKLALALLALAELAVASLFVESEDNTLRMELVAVKEPVVILGTVPAKLCVGVLVRP